MAGTIYTPEQRGKKLRGAKEGQVGSRKRTLSVNAK
jgi:hypothetical protein